MRYSTPFRQPIMRMVVRTTTPWDLFLAALVWVVMLAVFAHAQRLPEAPAKSKPAGPLRAPAVDQQEIDRLAVWNSPGMLSARAWLAEYFRTSKSATPEQEAAYAKRLSELSAQQMIDWLGQMQQKRTNLLRRQQHESYARSLTLDQAAYRRTAIAPTGVSARYTPAVIVTPPQNYVQRPGYQSGFVSPFGQSYSQPIYSFRLLHFLDTLDIRNDLRALRESGR